MEPNDQQANNQRAEQPNNAPEQNIQPRAEQPNNAPLPLPRAQRPNRGPPPQRGEEADDDSSEYEEARSVHSVDLEIRGLMREVKKLELTKRKQELLAQQENLRLTEIKKQFITLLAAKCAYKKIDRNLMPYIAAQLHMLGAEKQLTDLQIANMLEDENFMKSVVAKITKYYVIDNYEDANNALAHNKLMDATVTYRPWWWLWGSKDLTYERTPGFLTAPSLKVQTTSRNTPPIYLPIIGWGLLSLGVGYGIYRLFSHLMTTSTIPQAPLPPLPPMPIDTTQSSYPNMTPLLSKAFTNIYGNMWNIPFHTLEKNIVTQSSTAASENTIRTMLPLSKMEHRVSDIMSPPLLKLKKWEPISTNHQDLYKLAMSRLTSNLENILRSLKLWLQNKANIVIDSVKETMIRSPETLPSVPEDFPTQLKSTILYLMRMLQQKCCSLCTSTTKHVTHATVNCIECLKERLTTLFALSTASDGKCAELGCPEMWIHLSAIP